MDCEWQALVADREQLSFMASTGIIAGIVLGISAVWVFVSYQVAAKVYQRQDIT